MPGETHTGNANTPSPLEQWLSGAVKWPALSDATKTAIKGHIASWAQAHPDQFSKITGQHPGALDVSNPNAFVHAINSGLRANNDASSSGSGNGGGGTGSGTGTGTGSGSGSGTGGGGSGGSGGSGGNGATGGPGIHASVLPGVKGKDYHFVSWKGQTYVVYGVGIPGGRTVQMSWAVDSKDLSAYGVDSGSIRHITNAQHGQLQFFGHSSEITASGKDVHPWQQFLGNLKQDYGNISWIHDKQYMGIVLNGFFEGRSSADIAQQLTRTTWYQSRSDWQRQWETRSAKERTGLVDGMYTKMVSTLDSLYGPASPWAHQVDPKDVQKMASAVMSGTGGDPNAEGFANWLFQQQKAAQEIQGTAAWEQRQQQLQQQNDFNNRPEDKALAIKQQAQQWLGPQGTPDQGTLDNWAKDLVSGRKSDADWQSYLQGQAKSLYPYLGTNESWQDRASSYKQMAEGLIDHPIGWNDPLLGNLAETDAAGKATGGAVSYLDYAKQVRQTPDFWKGTTGRSQAFGLLAQLNSTFNGI